jgi:hypothetical protein
MQRPGLVHKTKLGLAAVAVLGLCGCGGQVGNLDSSDAGGSKPASVLGLGGGAAPKGAEAKRIFCPEIVVLEGTAASQVHAGTPPTNANLRYQLSLDDAVRECSLDGDKLAIKVGVAGKVLLGPAGAAGSFTVPVRMAVIRESDDQPLVSKLYRAAATIAAGQTYASYSIVSEPLLVPFTQDHAEEDYSIKVGIDEGGGSEKASVKRGKP